jgi:hypothetical protein
MIIYASLRKEVQECYVNSLQVIISVSKKLLLKSHAHSCYKTSWVRTYTLCADCKSSFESLGLTPRSELIADIRNLYSCLSFNQQAPVPLCRVEPRLLKPRGSVFVEKLHRTKCISDFPCENGLFN